MNRPPTNSSARPVRWRGHAVAWTVLFLCLGALGLGVYMNQGGTRQASDLPPLLISNIDGTSKPEIDTDALARFARQHQLTQIPDLNRLSVEAARDIYEALTALALQPTDAAAWGQLGRVFQSHQYPDKALTCYSRANSLAPNAHAWFYYIGRIHAQRYELDAAITAYGRAAELDPDYASTFLALGNLYQQAGELEQARKTYRRFVTLRPRSNHGYLGLAQVALAHQNSDAAVELLEDAISRDPKDFRCHNLLGQTYQRLGQTEKARYHLAIVQSLNRRDQRSKQMVFDDPLHHEMLAANSTDSALADRMRGAMGTGQPDVAIRLAEELCRRHPADADRLNSLAMALKQAERYAEALERAEKAIELQPGFLEAHLTKAQLLLILRRNKEALDSLDWIVAQEPDSFDGQYYRGAAQVLSNQYEAAVGSFRQAVRLRPDSARAHVALAEALAQTNQHEQATAEYRLAIELDPSNARARQRLREREP